MHEEAKRAYQDVLDMIQEFQVEACRKLQIPPHKLSIFMPQTTEAYTKLARKITEKLEPEQPTKTEEDDTPTQRSMRPRPAPHPKYPQR